MPEQLGWLNKNRKYMVVVLRAVVVVVVVVIVECGICSDVVF